MIEPTTWLAYLAATTILVLVPGPMVTVIIGNSLRLGAQAGLRNVLGGQIVLAVIVAVLTLGLSAVISLMGGLFDILRVLGAAYLVWLGIRLWRSNGSLAAADVAAPRTGFIGQGMLVMASNPKALLFLGAFIPQFIDPAKGAALQTLQFGLAFMVVAGVFDSGYAVLCGRAGRFLSRHRLRLLERLSGTALIGGGVWLALRGD